MEEDWAVKRDAPYIVISGLKSPDGFDFIIRILEGVDGFDEVDDNVDIEIVFSEDKKWIGTLFSIENIKTLLNKYKETGECEGGLYFWASDMVIVEKLTVSVIVKTILAMLKNREFELAFDGPHHSDGE